MYRFKHGNQIKMLSLKEFTKPLLSKLLNAPTIKKCINYF
jgi:hypothetical protein